MKMNTSVFYKYGYSHENEIIEEKKFIHEQFQFKHYRHSTIGIFNCDLQHC
jgi:hypothetical protein